MSANSHGHDAFCTCEACTTPSRLADEAREEERLNRDVHLIVRAIHDGFKMLAAATLFDSNDGDFDTFDKCAIAAEGLLADTMNQPTIQKRIETFVYRGTTRHSEMLSARFSDYRSGMDSFEFEGHRWQYEHTSFDDKGEYDVLVRFIP